MMLLKKFLGMKVCNFIKNRLQYRFHSDGSKNLKKGSLMIELKWFLNNGTRKVPQ